MKLNPPSRELALKEYYGRKISEETWQNFWAEVGRQLKPIKARVAFHGMIAERGCRFVVVLRVKSQIEQHFYEGRFWYCGDVSVDIADCEYENIPEEYPMIWDCTPIKRVEITEMIFKSPLSAKSFLNIGLPSFKTKQRRKKSK